MSECFNEAALRHFQDAEVLSAHGSLENADQLFGLSAECAIKSVLVQLPGCCAAGVLSSVYREHINRLWDLASVQNIQRLFPSLVQVLKQANPFANWSIDHRYGPNDAIAGEVLNQHRVAAKRVLGSVRLTGQRKR